MAAGGPYKRTDSWAAEETRGVRQGRNWRQKTDRRRRALEDDNDDGNKADKGQKGAVDNDGRETVVSSARTGTGHQGVRVGKMDKSNYLI